MFTFLNLNVRWSSSRNVIFEYVNKAVCITACEHPQDQSEFGKTRNFSIYAKQCGARKVVEQQFVRRKQQHTFGT